MNPIGTISCFQIATVLHLGPEKMGGYILGLQVNNKHHKQSGTLHFDATYGWSRKIATF